MKHQYFGDISDYRKYSLLRSLSDQGEIHTSICWMLTPDDPTSDGHRIRYLTEPGIWRNYDADLFDLLHDRVVGMGRRDLNGIMHSGLLKKCSFFSDYLYDDLTQRKKYMEKFLRHAKGAELVFFDPDNGIAVKSVPIGKRRSSKYLYHAEIETTYSCGHSILIYQHLPPKPRQKLASDIAVRLKNITGVSRVYLYWTQFVVFFLLPQPEHVALFTENTHALQQRWTDQITCQVM